MRKGGVYRSGCGGVVAGGRGGRYTPRPMMRLRIFAALVVMAVAVRGVSADEKVVPAPPGWELRNGSWVPLVQPGEGTPDAQVAQMIQDLKANETKKVISDAKQWEKVNKLHPLMPQVLVLQGDAEVARGNKYRALYSYEGMLLNYPSSDLYVHVLQREYNIADAFLNGYKRKFLGLRILPVTEDALTLLDRIQDRQRGSAIAEQAGIRLVDYYYHAGKFQEAVDACADFLKRYPYSQYVRKAEIRRAEASLGNFHGVLFDFTPLYDARERLAAISDEYPQTAEQVQVPAIDDRIYQLEGRKDLEIARYYWRAGKKHAAAYYYKRVMATWPDTAAAQSARAELQSRLPLEVGK
jgi:outer membrane protein assembly factor BamD (BamD/ComL family)